MGSGELVDTDELVVRWRVSARDVLRGVPREIAPHVVTAAVAMAWVLAPLTGGSAALWLLGLIVVAGQVAQVVGSVGRWLRAASTDQHMLTVHGASFVLTDASGAAWFDAPLVGVEDAHGLVRLHFTDGRSFEVPWHAFRNADLRRLRRHLRVRTGDPTEPAHVPVGTVGQVRGTAAWQRPVLALTAAAALAVTPWALPDAADADAGAPSAPGGGHVRLVAHPGVGTSLVA